MDHSAYIREVPGSDTAVLMMHGIVGTPRHFDMFLPLVPEEWSVYNLLLPGHGGTTVQFGQSSMKAWQAHAMETFDKLCGMYRRILLVGHSMGSLFAVRMALKRPEKVCALFLLAVPLTVVMKPVMAVNALRVSFGLVKETNPRLVASRDACGVETTLRLWQYLGWIPRFLELFQEIHRVKPYLLDLTVPTQAFQSRQDELVSRRSTAILRKNAYVQVTELPGAAHYYYPEADRKQMLTAFRSICEEQCDGHV